MFVKIATMIMILCFIPTSVFAAFLAIGQKSDYTTAWPRVEYKTDYSLSVSVHDQRPYVVYGEKSPTYTGTIRAGFGNPWNVNTQSGKPLSEDIASAVVSGLMRVGIQAKSLPTHFADDHKAVIENLKQIGAKRIAIITLREWKGDSYKTVGFFINADLRIYDEKGNELASTSVSHKNIGSGDGSVVSTDYAARLYLSMLLNDDKIKTALGGSQSVSEIKEIGRDGRFIAYNNGTVLDTKTSLMWADKDNEVDIDWNSVQNYCELYRGGGHKDWRMPAQHELFELYDSSKSRPSKCASDWNIGVITVLIDISCAYLWTSERGKSGLRAGAGIINFNDGKISMYPLNYSDYFRILPVRSVETTKLNHLKKTEAEVKKNNSGSSESAQKLRELKKMQDEGLITDKEYEQKRKAIVDGI
ncbi:MAG: DUF1566 domain-containing protein [Smithellaceae bacterium]|nr:DUF1566 domain-containing protein [Smithellaceae bacterium]